MLYYVTFSYRPAVDYQGNWQRGDQAVILDDRPESMQEIERLKERLIEADSNLQGVKIVIDGIDALSTDTY